MNADQAKLFLAEMVASGNITPAELIGLVNQLSIETPADGPGKLTLLYSGMLNGEISSGMLAQYIASDSSPYKDSLRVIDSRGAAKFVPKQMARDCHLHQNIALFIY